VIQNEQRVYLENIFPPAKKSLPVNTNSNSAAQRRALWLSRRQVLRVGASLLGGLTLPRLLAAEDISKKRDDAAQQEPSNAFSSVSTVRRAESCILIFLNGGPSHLDMWDMKPDGPAEIRGVFQPIATSLPDVQLCEHLPRLATQIHRATLIRSMHHSVNNSHAAAVYAALTGHDRGEQGGGAKATDYPPPGAVLSMLQPSAQTPISYVSLPYKTQEGAGGPLQPGFQAGFIGQKFNPFWIVSDPNVDPFSVPNLGLVDGVTLDRMASRRELLSLVDDTRRLNDVTGVADSTRAFHERALEVLTSAQAQQAFELNRETPANRDRFGRNIYGQSVLLARRLIEAGTRLVTISWAPDANATWDTHGDNFNKLKNNLLPTFDAACTSLIEDLHDRGMLDRTLVAVLGDFGRTPKINAAAGRDHWNSCYSVMLCGGGVKPGFVYGASDRTGSEPLESPVSPGDVIATIYSLFGIDHNDFIYDQFQRPMPLIPHGRVIRGIIA
jgi:Protein of unknown function (DUF1501)